MAARGQTEETPWWRSTTVYQIYPRSFQDSNGDGIGDIPGIISRLDHLTYLGVGTIWLSPFFRSPQRDFGYDVSDYFSVAPEYGTLEDVDRLIAEAHARGLRVIFDLVLNHTSDEHPWFVESRSSRENPKADWYIWAEGRGPGGAKPPNNWRSALEVTSAWQWDEKRGQWYLASFLPCQPDLNWHNPAVREAMWEVVHFWLDRGVDGFRLDMFHAIMKDARLRDNPLRPRWSGSELLRLWDPVHTLNTEENFELAKQLRSVCRGHEPPERMLVGEVFGRPAQLRRYLGDGDGLQLVFLFDFLAFRWSADFFRRCIERYERHFPHPFAPALALENHDRSRSLDRVGGSLDKARSLAVLQLTLRAVPFIYQGQEIGMTNTYIPLRDAKDPIARQHFRWVPEFVSRRLPERINRDEVRTPMQWTPRENAGFCPPEVNPWLPLNPNHVERNVESQRGVAGSHLELYRALLQLRRERSALSVGDLVLLRNLPPDVLAYGRICGDDRMAVYVNFSHQPRVVRIPKRSRLALATHADCDSSKGELRLHGHSAAIIDVT
ncbi:MAG: oligo-1,6-glucosidase [Acidimicrobiales bacterium]|nr:MAG: oligo-1,6-glucosidase [Acidimicrobiales bacterium]